jgi:hypothetical protein
VIYQEGDTIVGSNTETGAAVAEKLGVEVDWFPIGFNGFIAAAGRPGANVPGRSSSKFTRHQR